MQVDLIVCYDATSSPTRAIQRMGRTGRHKEGRVVYILSAGREEEKFRQIEEVGGCVVLCGWVVWARGVVWVGCVGAWCCVGGLCGCAVLRGWVVSVRPEVVQ